MDDIKITIRKMTKEDADAVGRIEYDSFSEPWPVDEFVKVAEADNYIYLVALDHTEVVGYAGCFVTLDGADVTNIAVDSAYKRIGIGEMLLRLLASESEKKGAEALFLEVRESNEPAVSMYTKLGFYNIGIRKAFYRKPTENAILMKKDLK